MTFEEIGLLILWLSFFLLDVTLTHHNMKKIVKLRPTDWKEYEVNVYVKWFWSKFGFKNGTILATITQGSILIAIFFMMPSYLRLFMLGMMIGIYGVIFSLHAYNWEKLQEGTLMDMKLKYGVGRELDKIKLKYPHMRYGTMILKALGRKPRRLFRIEDEEIAKKLKKIREKEYATGIL